MKILPFIKKLSPIGAAFTLVTLWLALIRYVLPYLIVGTDYTGKFIYSSIGIFFFGCILAPLWEELAFRHAPLQMAKALKTINLDVLIPFVIISSSIFGWAHGYGPVSILIQGIGGIILSLVYVQNNYSYWSSVFLHFLWNFSLIYVFPVFTLQYGLKVW